MDKYSYVGNGDVNAIEDLFLQYKKDANSVDESWARFFEGFEFAQTQFDLEEGGVIPENIQKEFKVINLIDSYRKRGHLFTKTNPVRERRQYNPDLSLVNFGLDDNDLETFFKAGSEVGIGEAKLKDIIKHLEETYCQSIGIEFAYMREPNRLGWFKNMIEIENRPSYSKDDKLEIFNKLNQATMFEQFLQKKYVGQKRFSVEGSEALIPGLEWMMRKGAENHGVKEFVIGMAHRGRINTLTNIFGKDPYEIFKEFDGKEFDYEDKGFDGDVKYHLGYSTDVELKSGEKLHLTLAPNPSHLEAVDPVVEGIVRAKIDGYLKDEKEIVPVLIHGDAAIAGQGIVYEIIQMAQLDGYRTGGTIHVVVNNQVGFTTNYLDARSSTYCTDVAKTTLSPVFHVNGDDVEAVVQTFEMALRYRQEFNRDVFIDILSYRKYGHNEGDEPKFTQPKLYKSIAKHPNPREIYLNQLLAQGEISEDQAAKMAFDYQENLEGRYDASKKDDIAIITPFLESTWNGLRYGNSSDFALSVDTSVNATILEELAVKVTSLPEGKKYFRKIKKIYDDRKSMISSDKLDWGMAETLAYATLLNEGHPVRISGQDVERGTFSHRHAVVKTEDTEEEVLPLNLLSDTQAQLSIYNSLLSEYGVLGFEYGYSLTTPNALTVWEAQFGDFFNGAQIMIDQFIAAGEDKWKVQSGLVMLLPHGYEGMGAEHSSARIERFLQMSADLNWQVTNASTPANFYHLLRRQLKREFRKPLVVFTPKMLLRYPKAVSSMNELANGSFQELIDDPINVSNKDEIKNLVFCSGKAYYEIQEKIEAEGIKDFAIVRLEQMYPLPQKQIDDLIASYKNVTRLIWAQEEPENMGAWWFVRMQIPNLNWEVVAKPSSSAPAAGSSRLFSDRKEKWFAKLFQKELV